MDPEFADAYYHCAKSIIKLNPDDNDLCLEYLYKAIALDRDYKENAKIDNEFTLLRKNVDFALLVTK